MPKEEENMSQKFYTEKKKNPDMTQKLHAQNYLDEQYSHTINFLLQPVYLKLRNLTNLQDNSRNSSDYEIEMLLARIKELEEKVQFLEKRIKYKKKKRIRRTSEQILKQHKCEVCNKKYGSLVSLNLHLRIKHSAQRVDEKIQSPQIHEKQEAKKAQ